MLTLNRLSSSAARRARPQARAAYADSILAIDAMNHAKAAPSRKEMRQSRIDDASFAGEVTG
jgi:hypothetical protein